MSTQTIINVPAPVKISSRNFDQVIATESFKLPPSATQTYIDVTFPSEVKAAWVQVVENYKAAATELDNISANFGAERFPRDDQFKAPNPETVRLAYRLNGSQHIEVRVFAFIV